MKSRYHSIFILWLLLMTLSSEANDNLDLGTPSRDGQLVDRTGYAFLYSEKHEQPLWVSYKLTKAEVQNKVAKRKDNFRLDPVIKTGSAILADYEGSGYDRGHLAPAGDMAWSKETMSESFFLTNMSPQVPGLNRGMWRILEEQIRKWTRKEKELYIITGPIIRPNYKTIGPNKVTVPQWYYKIIVDYHEPEIKALAFMIPNRKPQKSLHSFAVSIDKLEEVTQLDFLNLLPQKVQEQLESKVNLSQWKLPAAKAGKPDKSKINKLLQESADKTTQLTVSEAGLGGLKPDTPFSEDQIQQLFPNFDIVKDSSSTEGELFPVFCIRKDGQDILVINPTSDYQHIFSVQIKSKTVKNQLEANLGSTYHDVYGNQLDKSCSPGVEEQSGKIICLALGSKRIMYVFAGEWHGPDGVLPPIEILRSWELSEIVWKP